MYRQHRTLNEYESGYKMYVCNMIIIIKQRTRREETFDEQHVEEEEKQVKYNGHI